MSEFVLALRAERARLLPDVDPPGLPSAQATLAAARADFEAFRESAGVGGGSSEQRGAYLGAITAAEQAVADLTRRQARARARVKEIDRLLTAAADAKAARTELDTRDKSIADARARLAQIAGIENALRLEVDELGQKRAIALSQYGKDEMTARLAGKTVAAPRALSNIGDDIEARNATLVSTLAAKAEIEATLRQLGEESKVHVQRLRSALVRRAELDYFEALPTLLPIIARLVVTGSPLRNYDESNAVTIRCDKEVLREATLAFEAELTGREGVCK